MPPRKKNTTNRTTATVVIPSSAAAVRNLLLQPGKTKEPAIHNRPPPIQLEQQQDAADRTDDPNDQKNQAWFCTCENGHNENCKRRTTWAALAGRDRFSKWLASKHIGEVTAEDYFPIYLLLKVKHHISRELLRDMYSNFHAEVHELALNSHTALKVACDHLDIPWNAKAYLAEQKPKEKVVEEEEAELARNGEEGEEEEAMSNGGEEELANGDDDDPAMMEVDFDDDDEKAKERKLIIDHLINVMCALMQHIFHYISPIDSSELLELLNTIYLDLLKVNSLSQNNHFFCFSPVWLRRGFLEVFPKYEECITFRRPLATEKDIGEDSVTEVVRTNDLRSIEKRLQERKKPPASEPLEANERPQMSQKKALAMARRAKAKAAIADALEMWKYSYLDEMLEDSDGITNEEDAAAAAAGAAAEEDCGGCGQADCEQCLHGSCLCGGHRCYVLCRSFDNNKFIFGNLMAKNAPHLYLGALQEEVAREAEVRELDQRREKLTNELTLEMGELFREAEVAAEERRRQGERREEEGGEGEGEAAGSGRRAGRGQQQQQQQNAGPRPSRGRASPTAATTTSEEDTEEEEENEEDSGRRTKRGGGGGGKGRSRKSNYGSRKSRA